jgi:P27 family predicted phage terminase small subunit
MTAGRKPKPTHLKLVTGNPGKRALPTAEAKPATALYKIGLLSGVDRAALAAYCQAYARWVQAERAIAEMAKRDQLTGGLMIKTTNGNAIQNPLVGTANKAATDMVRFAAEFGMTPSARSRINVTPPGEGERDPAAQFFTG